MSANWSCSTSFSMAATDWTISACKSSSGSGSSSSNWANPSASFTCVAIFCQVETSSCDAFNCCICVCALQKIATKVNEALGLAQLLEEEPEPDEDLQAEIVQSVAAIENEVEQLQFALMLSGEHDQRNAL